MESVQSLLTMGGYAGYVWPAYGIAVVAMVTLLVASLRGARAAERDLALLQQARPSRRRPAAATGGDDAQPGEAKA